MGELEEWSARHQVLKATLPHRVVSSCSSFKTNQKFHSSRRTSQQLTGDARTEPTHGELCLENIA